MLKVMTFKTEKIVGNVNHIRAEIVVDNASDLATECASGVFTQGSIAWVIETGDFYGLKSDGTWVRQGASAPSEPEETTEEVEAGDT